jgi:hypothetical protein
MDSEPKFEDCVWYRHWLAFELAGLWPDDSARAEVLRMAKVLYQIALRERQSDQKRDGGGDVGLPA